VGELLYRRYPDLREGQLTLVRSELVREKQLFKFAIALGIGDKIRLGKGTIQDGGRQNPSLLSDAFEAIVGAYFLDSGIEEVRPNWRLGHQQQLKNQWVQPSAARPIRAEKIELSTS
jgi:ribonuclease-3